MKKLAMALKNAKGQSLIEYVFILSLSSIAAAVVLTQLGAKLLEIFSAVGSAL